MVEPLCDEVETGNRTFVHKHDELMKPINLPKSKMFLSIALLNMQDETCLTAVCHEREMIIRMMAICNACLSPHSGCSGR